MVVYGESLRKMVAIPKDSSIKASKEKGQKKFSAHLATLSGFPQVEFDPESTQISPGTYQITFFVLFFATNNH